MSLLNPAALALLLGIPVVVLLHLLKIRRRQAVVSSTLFWEESLREREATAPFRRLKPSLLLLLQILIILALSLALAQPVRTTLALGYARQVLVLDLSASMQATDLGGSRLAAARRAALEAVDRLRPGQQAMLVASGREARVVVPFTEEAGALRRALAELGPEDAPGRLADALRLVGANLRGTGPPAAVEVFTDGAFDPAGLPALEGAALTWHAFGRRGENVGITAFEVRKTHFGRQELQAFLGLTNFGSAPADFDLRLALDGRPIRTERVRLGPAVRRAFVFPFAQGEGGLLTAEIARDDDLAADNRAAAVIPPPRPIRVLLIGQGSPFLEKALAADRQVQVETGSVEALAAPVRQDVVILDGVPAPALPPGRYLLINTLPAGLPLELLGRVQEPPILDWDRTHPTMRYLDLSKVAVQEAMRLRPVGAGRALVDSSLTPLVYALEEGGVRAVVVGFDLARSDLPLRVAFPLLVSQTLRWLQPARLEEAGQSLQTGQPLRVSLPPGAAEAVLRGPGGEETSLRADAHGQVEILETARAGLYRLRAGAWEQAFALNLLAESESDIAPRPLPAAAAASAEEGGASFPARQELWRLFALLALGLLLLEGGVYLYQAGGRWPATAAALRAAVLLLVGGALAGVGLYRTTDQLTVLFLLDASDSVPLESRLEARRYVAEAAKQAGPRDRFGVVVFGGTPSLEQPVGGGEPAGGPPLAADPRATDIGGAIRLALAAFPREGARRIVLLSDGNENQGSARQAAHRARAAGVDIHAVPLGGVRPGEVLVERLVVPAEVKLGESFLLRVVAWSAGESSGRLSLYRDGEFVGAQPVTLVAGKNVFAYQQALERPGVHVYQARLESPQDGIAENNRGVGLVAARGRPTVLYVERDREQGSHLLRALRAQSLLVEMVGPEALPSRMEALTKYDSVILSNVSALRMSKPQMELLRAYVRDQGGGLVMLGGDESFGVGGFYRTAVEEALPVTMEARQKVEVPSLAVALVLDRSGSMESSVEPRFSKLDLAKEAAQLVVELLDEQNEVGVIAFDTAWSWVVPMGPAKDKDRIIREIASIKAGGGTDLFPPLKEAYETIYDRRALLRHVLVLSDGEVSAANFPGLVQRMQKDKITVSSVAVGKDSDVRFMTDLSRWGRGRFYYTEDIYSIPRILTLETQLASKAAIIEQAFRPRPGRADHEILQDVGLEAAPPLGGYVATTLKPTADPLLLSHQRDPVLAAWRYGLGRSVAFTSDAKAKWGILWLRWEEFGKLFGQMVRWTLRTAQRREVTATVQERDGQGEILLEAIDEQGEFINFLEATAGVVSPDKRQRALPLEQVGPGRYRATFPAADQGAYLVGVSERRERRPAGSEVASLVVPYSPEHRALAPNEALLRELVGLTAGAFPAAPAENFTRERRPARAWVDGWPYLLAAALLAFLPDVALRRLWPQGLRRGRPAAAGGGPAGGGPGGPPTVVGRFGGRRPR